MQFAEPWIDRRNGRVVEIRTAITDRLLGSYEPCGDFAFCDVKDGTGRRLTPFYTWDGTTEQVIDMIIAASPPPTA